MLDILSDFITSTDAHKEAFSAGRLTTVSKDDGLALVFADDVAAPVQCALEVWETIREVPSLSVAMALCSGLVTIEGDRATGEGWDAARQLLAGASPGEIRLSDSYSTLLGTAGAWSARPVTQVMRQSVCLVGGDEDADTAKVRSRLEKAITAAGHRIVAEGAHEEGIEWAQFVEQRVRSSDAVVAIIPEGGTPSEFAQYQLEIAADERAKRGKPQIVPVWIRGDARIDGPLAILNQNLHHAVWFGEADNERVANEVCDALEFGQREKEAEQLNPDVGPPEDRYYVVRPADRHLESALQDHESIVLVKGPRQIGKTSLIGRGIRLVDRPGWRWAATDFQKLGSRQMEDEDAFYAVLAATLSLDLDHPFDPDRDWRPALGPTVNMGRFLRGLVAAADTPLVWFIDEADRLFPAPFASDFFGLVRSWHNSRATDPRGPWSRLTIVIGYATEAHLFIDNLNQSPFNVGRSIPLSMFTLADTEDLNTRFGRPITQPADVEELHRLVGGHPYLTRQAFDVLARGDMNIASLLADADQEIGPFGSHLKRVLVSVTQLPYVADALKTSLGAAALPDSRGLQRLVAAGVLVQAAPDTYRLPNELYRRYLNRHLSGGG